MCQFCSYLICFKGLKFTILKYETYFIFKKLPPKSPKDSFINPQILLHINRLLFDKRIWASEDLRIWGSGDLRSLKWVHDICSPRTFVPQMSHRAHIASMPSKLSGIVALIYGYIHINLGSNTRSVVPSRHLGNKCPWGTNILNPLESTYALF